MAESEVSVRVDAASDLYKGMSSDNIKGLVMALSSSAFIGGSFIVKKKGLKKAGASGIRAEDKQTSFIVFVPPTESDILHPCDVAEARIDT
ncbi:probable magnesium transporter NIPA4 [Olea europaea subsp. europaea]|uniref:Probable magnesium transporter NIPA4 n=1 Tax=Olea europaea subsp. europaea TaxID=158383 RepID=A0A8S0R6H7_OLEEU|nr:probable magnesium transporter NIPA4 [Olea europaea subsp. europaea]